MHVVFTNYGDDSIALIQYLHEQAVTDVTVISVDTGWAAPRWQARVTSAEAYARSLGFVVERLTAAQGFTDLVKARGSFPNKKFGWCAGLLKGMTLLTWLDEHDPCCEATIVLAKRRTTSRAASTLPEFIESSEHYGERHVWHPLYASSNQQVAALFAKSGLCAWGRRSLECDPCIHSLPAELAALEPKSIAATRALEQAVGRPMFLPEQFSGAKGIEAVVKTVQNAESDLRPERPNNNPNDVFDRGCGSPFSCGD